MRSAETPPCCVGGDNTRRLASSSSSRAEPLARGNGTTAQAQRDAESAQRFLACACNTMADSEERECTHMRSRESGGEREGNAPKRQEVSRPRGPRRIFTGLHCKCAETKLCTRINYTQKEAGSGGGGSRATLRGASTTTGEVNKQTNKQKRDGGGRRGGRTLANTRPGSIIEAVCLILIDRSEGKARQAPRPLLLPI